MRGCAARKTNPPKIILSPALGMGASISPQRKQNISMNGYLFTAGLTQTQVIKTPGRGGQMIDTIQTWDSCASAIIYGGDPEQAQARFEAWCRGSPEGENPAEVEIKKVIAA